MAYPGSNQSRECFFDQALGNHNNIWPQGLKTGFPRNSGCNKPVTSAKVPTRLSPGSPYHQLTPSFDPRSPDPTFTRGFNRPNQGYLSSIQTELTCKGEPELSPLAFSPVGGGIYSGTQSFGGSTPSLVSSNSSPPTGKFANILLTPEVDFQSGNQLPGSPNYYDKSGIRSPMSYNPSTGTTPDMGMLHLEESGLQLAHSAKGPGTLHSQQSSVLLGSNSGSQNSQSAHLDPLDLDNKLTDLEHFDGQLSTNDTAGFSEEYHGININIVSATAGNQNVPITVALDAQQTWDPAYQYQLSPLTQLQALPISYEGDVNEYQQMFGVVIEPTNWALPVVPQTASPSPSNTCSDRRLPSLTPSVSRTPLSPEAVFHGGNDHQGRFRNYKHANMTGSEAQEALEAMRAGQQPRSIVNPKGVSERTLLAAEANRKREAKFRCDICGNSQTSKQNLENHVMSRHMQLKRFICPVPNCGAKYGHARGVNRHLDSKHPGHRQVGSKGKRGPPKRVQT